MGHGARLIVFDEPTSSLSQHEVDRLYALIDRLQDAGRHLHLRQPPPRRDLPALRRHHRAARRPARRHAADRVAHPRHAGRDDDRPEARATYFPAHAAGKAGEEALRVEGLSSPAGFSDVSFAVRAGEVARLRRARRLRTLGSGASGLRTRSARDRPRVRPRQAGASSTARAGDCRRHRPRAGGPQAAGAGAVDGRARRTRRCRSCRGSPALGFISRAVEQTAAQPFFERLS